jgi:hypothetical protein
MKFKVMKFLFLTEIETNRPVLVNLDNVCYVSSEVVTYDYLNSGHPTEISVIHFKKLNSVFVKENISTVFEMINNPKKTLLLND